MIRILHLTTGHTPTDIRIVQKECLALAEAGYDVALAAPDDGRPAEIGPVRLIRVPPSRGRLERYLRMPRRLREVAHREDADLYHLHDPELMPLARQLRREGRRVIFDMHENLPKDILTKRWIPHGLRRGVSWCAAAGLRRWLDDVPVVFAEESYAADFQWASPSCVILNMPLVAPLLAMARLHVRRARRVHQPSLPTIGYLGVVDEDHGSHAALDAMARLARHGISVSFDCVGPIGKRHERELRARAGSLRLRHVHLHGYLRPSEAWQRIAPCRVGLALLARRPNLIDSYPTKLFEYMALGIPVIASNFPLYREVVERAGCGFCVEPGDIDDVVRRLRWLCDHEEQAWAMGRRGQEAVLRHYRWETESRKLLAFYGDVLNRPIVGKCVARRAA